MICRIIECHVLVYTTSFLNMTSNTIVTIFIAASTANSQLLRSAAVQNNNKSCMLGAETMYHSQAKYLSGNGFTAGSIYARCWMGKPCVIMRKRSQTKKIIRPYLAQKPWRSSKPTNIIEACRAEKHRLLSYNRIRVQRK